MYRDTKNVEPEMCDYFYYYYYPSYDFYAGYLQLHTRNKVHSVAAVLYLQFVLHVMFISPVKCVFYIYISTFRSVCALRVCVCMCACFL
jgi:hypothetical protein